MASNLRPDGACDSTPAQAPAEQHPQIAPEPAPAMDRRILLGLAGIAGVAALTKLAQAGELAPPAGPISPTGVSLSQIAQKQGNVEAAVTTIKHMVSVSEVGIAEPRIPLRACPGSLSSGQTCQFAITQPGAYCMTENVVQQPGMDCCVSIECDGVDLDCQGFAFVGSGNAASPPSPCVRASGRADIELYDCAFRSWRGCPIDCDDCDDCYFSDINFRHCTCPPGIASDGSSIPAAMIRCRDGCEIDDVAISSCDGCAVVVRDSSSVSDARWTSCSGQACVCRDSCCVEDIAIVGCALTVSGTPGGSPTGLITLGASCSAKGVEGRVCTCPLGEYFCVLGVRCTAEDMSHTTIFGDCLSCDDHCSLSDMQFASCTGHGIQARHGECVEDVSFHQHTGDCITCLDNCAVCDVECRACTGVAITCGLGACVEECAISSHTGDCVRCASSSCVTEVECRSCVGVCISVGTSSLVEDCDVSGGGGGGAIRCQDGSCVRRARSASRDMSVDIAVTDNCSVEDCTIVRGQGISAGSSCTISCNKLSSCVGVPGSTAGAGGAIVITGSHTCVDENELNNCPAGIVARSSAHYCSIDDNHITDGGGGAGGSAYCILVESAAVGVLCTCNHLRPGPGGVPIIPGSSSYGPLVPLQPLGGDLSSSPPSAHHLANFIVS